MLARCGLLLPEWVLRVSLLLTELRREVACPAEASPPEVAAFATFRPIVLKRLAKGLLPWLGVGEGDSAGDQLALGGTGKGGILLFARDQG